MRSLVGLGVFLFAHAALAANNGVAVLDIQGTGVDEGLLPTLTEVLTVEIDALGKYKVVAGRDVQAMLGFEKQKDVLGCTEASCLAEIGGALGVDRIVAGHIGKVGGTYVVNIKLINIKNAETEGRVYETVKGEVDTLIDTIRRSVGKLFANVRDTRKTARAPASAPAPVQAQAQAESPASETPPPASVETKGPGRSTGTLVGSITLMGVGVGGVVVGAVMGLRAKSDATCANDRTCVGGQVAATNAPTEALVANIGFGVGIAAVGGGLLWMLLSGGPSSAAPASSSATEAPTTTLQWTPWLAPQVAGLSCAGRF